MTNSGSGTENLYYQGFSVSGSATTAPVQVLSNVSTGTQYYVGYTNGVFYYRYTYVNGASTGLYGGTFDPTTGALGTAAEVTALPSFTSFSGVASRTVSNGNALRVYEGVSNGSDVLDVIYNNVSTPTATFALTSTSDRFAIANVYDPANGQLDYTALAYADNSQVHLELLDATGNQIGSDFIVPGITSFDRMTTLTGSNNLSDTRVELDYTTAGSSGTQIQGLIYDTATSGYVYTIGSAGDNEYNGSPFNDTISWAAGQYYVDGGGGYDTFSATALTSSQATVTENAAGQVVVSDGSGDITTLARFSVVQLNGSTYYISGNVLTQYNADGTSAVATYTNGTASVSYADLSGIFWQNQTDGSTYQWLMGGNNHTGNSYAGGLLGWTNAGSFAFNGATGAGVMWQNQSSGQVYLWNYVNDTHSGNDAFLGTLQGWKSAGVGAFKGAGTAGVLWQNTTSGEVYEWTIANGQHTGADIDVGNLNGWNEAVTGDFNGDGTSDVLWQNATSGAVYEWQMSNGKNANSVYLGNLTGYTALGAGAFTGTETRDILWQNNSSGEVWEWEMNSSGTVQQGVDLGNVSGYKVVAIGDYSGSGTDSIVWQNTSSGAVWLWSMTNGQHTGSVYLGAYSGWTGSGLTLS